MNRVRRNTVVGLLSVGLMLLSCSGCQWLKPFWVREVVPDQPTRLSTSPTLEDVVYVVNANSQALRQLQSEDVLIRTAGVRLQAQLAMERPQRFRLRAAITRLTGDEVDIGSNDDLMWFWVKRSPQAAAYFVRHEEFARSAANQLIPVNPRFLMDALGLVQLDPNQAHQGPFPSGPNRLRLVSRLASARGELTRVMIIDDRYGWILEQEIYDVRGKLLASAISSRHKYYPELDATLPMQVHIYVGPGANSPATEMDIEVGDYALNQPLNQAIWQMPEFSGFPRIDLGKQQLGSQ